MSTCTTGKMPVLRALAFLFSASCTLLIRARLDMRRRVAFAKRLLDLVFDCAGDAMPVIDVPLGRDHDVEIDPVIAAAVAMPQLVIATDPWLARTVWQMRIENPSQQHFVGDVLFVPPDHVSYVLNHPQPYSGLPLSEFTAATQTPWSEIAHGGEAPSTAALRGESLLGTRPNNVVARAAAELAERIAAEAREQTALSGRPG